MAPQVSRILMVFGAFLLLFLGLRSMMVPIGFGEEGFHRKEAPAKIAASPIRFAGSKACGECHPDKAEKTLHVKKGVRCESCHGAAEAHVLDWEAKKPLMPATRADCARCHAQIVSRPDWYPQIDPKTHNPDGKCIGCHEIHAAAE